MCKDEKRWGSICSGGPGLGISGAELFRFKYQSHDYNLELSETLTWITRYFIVTVKMLIAVFPFLCTLQGPGSFNDSSRKWCSSVPSRHADCRTCCYAE
jgi:hypothetical protein